MTTKFECQHCHSDSIQLMNFDLHTDERGVVATRTYYCFRCGSNSTFQEANGGKEDKRQT